MIGLSPLPVLLLHFLMLGPGLFHRWSWAIWWRCHCVVCLWQPAVSTSVVLFSYSHSPQPLCLHSAWGLCLTEMHSALTVYRPNVLHSLQKQSQRFLGYIYCCILHHLLRLSCFVENQCFIDEMRYFNGSSFIRETQTANSFYPIRAWFKKQNKNKSLPNVQWMFVMIAEGCVESLDSLFARILVQ